MVFSVECQEGQQSGAGGGGPLAWAGPEEASTPLFLPPTPSLLASPELASPGSPGTSFPGPPSCRERGPEVAGWPELPSRANADVGPAHVCQCHSL